VVLGALAALILSSDGRHAAPERFGPTRPAEARIWLTRAEVRRLPMTGPGWENVLYAANAALEHPQVSDPNSLHDTSTLAVALVAVRTGDRRYTRKAADAIDAAIGTEHAPSPSGSRHLPICRNATAYVIAADLIDLGGYGAARNRRFREWLRALRDDYHVGEDPTWLIHETRPNNHGTMCGAARAAISRYLGDDADLARTAQVLKGWMGDRDAFSFHEYPPHSGSYIADSSHPRPVNPAGAEKDGHTVDGLLPAEHARCGEFHWPPCYTFYPWGGLAGVLVTAEILRRAGYADVFDWQHKALLRAYTRLYDLSKLDPRWWEEAASGDDSWQPWLVNRIYKTHFPAVTPTTPGRNMGWTDWTDAPRRPPRDAARARDGAVARAPAGGARTR
jgi:hypothetical protein